MGAPAATGNPESGILSIKLSLPKSLFALFVVVRQIFVDRAPSPVSWVKEFNLPVIDPAVNNPIKGFLAKG